jgi:uncharacterized surface protein with fasciclin (FAS1) repeats
MKQRWMKHLTGVVVSVLTAATLSWAAEEGQGPAAGTQGQATSSGTITKVDALTGEFTVQDRDGKAYVIKRADVVAQDLKTGDTVVYEIIESAPAHLRKGSSGKITKIDAVTGEVTVQGSDGKAYVVKKTDVVAKDLKTGETVAYEIIDGVPAHVMRSES